MKSIIRSIPAILLGCVAYIFIPDKNFSPLKTMLIILFGFLGTFAYLFFPENRDCFPFPFQRGQMITVQAHVDYIMTRGFYILMSAVIYSNYARWEFMIVFFLMVGYLIDYLLIYNQPIAYIKNGLWYEKPEGWFIPVGYPMLMAVILVGLIIKIVITK